MTTTEIIKILSTRFDLPQTQTHDLLERILVLYRDTLAEGKKFTHRNFGTFDLKERPARRTYNPTKKQWLRLPPKLAVHFRPGSKLKKQVNERNANESENQVQ